MSNPWFLSKPTIVNRSTTTFQMYLLAANAFWHYSCIGIYYDARSINYQVFVYFENIRNGLSAEQKMQRNIHTVTTTSTAIRFLHNQQTMPYFKSEQILIAKFERVFATWWKKELKCGNRKLELRISNKCCWSLFAIWRRFWSIFAFDTMIFKLATQMQK